MVATDGSGGYAGTISYGADSERGGRAVLWKNGKFTDYGNLADPEYLGAASRSTAADGHDPPWARPTPPLAEDVLRQLKASVA